MLVLIGSMRAFKLSELVLALLFMAWGYLSIIYKKHNIKDGSLGIFGAFIIGLGIYECSSLVESGFPQGGQELRVELIFLALSFFGGGLLVYKGYKKHLEQKESI